MSHTKTRQPPSEAAIIDSVGLEISNYSAWKDLDALSNRTVFDGLDVMIESLEFDEETGRFSVDVVLNVALSFGGKGDDSFSTADAFPGRLVGEVKPNGMLYISDLTVDTSTAYE